MPGKKPSEVICWSDIGGYIGVMSQATLTDPMMGAPINVLGSTELKDVPVLLGVAFTSMVGSPKGKVNPWVLVGLVSIP